METNHLNHVEVAPEKPSSSDKLGLPNKNEVQMSTLPPISSGRRYSLRLHGYKNSVRTIANERLMASSTTGTSGSSNGEKGTGQPGQAQRSKATQLRKDLELPVKSSRVDKSTATENPTAPIERIPLQKTSALRNVWKEKSRIQPSVCQPKPLVKCNAPTWNDTSNVSSESRKDTTLPVKSSRIQRTSTLKDPAPPTKRSGIQKSSVPHEGKGIQKDSASKDPASPMKRSGTQKASTPSQVQCEKTEAQPSASLSKSSSELATSVYHISWNGFDEPVGLNCCLCNEDLSEYPNDDVPEYYDEFEQSTLPEVSILPCGHAFHSSCLQQATPEEHSRDPSCFLCLSSHDY
ncbi:unnamed protein product [Ilex paraguariensis]|uniref:RING-type domain-containing protein n=1 Tax=Ilex paraguariensis TaxID=185542 RepID=A0ABC8TRH5_9AQUA